MQSFQNILIAGFLFFISLGLYANKFTLKLQPAFTRLSLVKPLLLLQNGVSQSLVYILQQEGRVVVFDRSKNGAGSKRFADIGKIRGFRAGGERGLLGMAFDPSYAKNRFVFISYTIQESGQLKSVISRFKVSKDHLKVDLSSKLEIIKVNQPYGNHNGGHILFGPDSFLYIGLGDGGSANDPLEHSQNKNTLLGNILRIDVSKATAKKPYSIPSSNPFVGKSGRDEIWAYGIRNPWRFSFDSKTNKLWVADVGQNLWEEVNIVEKGGNYGWNIREASHCLGRSSCRKSGFVEPIIEYGRKDGASITGGYVYRGSKYPKMQGQYIYGDYVSGKIWSFDASNPSLKQKPQLLVDTSHYISSFGEMMDGDIYMLSMFTGKVFRVQGI